MMPGHNILLVEDEVGIRDAFAMLLEIEGYRVQVAVDGVDAVDCIARAPFDLVITDYMMPRMDGLELARTLRSSAPRRVPPIILITAAHRLPEAERHVDAVLSKPIDSEALLQTVRELLHH